jgi:hypothetical protein
MPDLLTRSSDHPDLTAVVQTHLSPRVAARPASNVD